ncbi:MAG: hypothetical protein PHI88_02905 [Candidatus Pacebacteria bacterium]|nr:hypothetical protein [Candidatus Paceibacterota bacterium]
MATEKFIEKQEKKLKGEAEINWDKIPRTNSDPIPFIGQEAWDKINNFSPLSKHHLNLMGKEVAKSFKYIIEEKEDHYKSFLREEKEEEGKVTIGDLKREGLREPIFLAFAYNNPFKRFIKGFWGILADGNHRFIMCKHLIWSGEKDFIKDIERCRLYIIYLKNLRNLVNNNLKEAL